MLEFEPFFQHYDSFQFYWKANFLQVFIGITPIRLWFTISV